MVTCTGHIGIHEGADGRTDVYDVMAIKPNFLTSMGYHIFLTMVLRSAISQVRDDLLQLKRIEPTNRKKLTAVRIFLTRVGSHGIDQVLSSNTR